MRSEPEIAFYQRCIDVCGCQPQECLYIDDRDDYVDVARKLGMHAETYDASTTDLSGILWDYGVAFK